MQRDLIAQPTMNHNESTQNQSVSLNSDTKSGKSVVSLPRLPELSRELLRNGGEKGNSGEVRPLKDALLRLSVSPIKADRDAIARIERETGKDIQVIIQELDSAEITLKAIEENAAQTVNPLQTRIGWGLFFGSLVGLGALFLLSSQQVPMAIALGIMLGASIPFRRYFP